MFQRTSPSPENAAVNTPPAHPLTRFIGVGSIATVVQLGLLAGLATVIEQTWANLIAWTVSTLIANAAHRRVTFGIKDPAGARRDMLVASAFSIAALVLSTAALNQLQISHAVGAVLVLVAVNALVGAVRYAGLHWWFISRAAREVDRLGTGPFAAAA